MIYRITTTYDVIDVSLSPPMGGFHQISTNSADNADQFYQNCGYFRPLSTSSALSNFDYFRPFPNNADGNVYDNADKDVDQCLTVATISDRFRPISTRLMQSEWRLSPATGKRQGLKDTFLLNQKESYCQQDQPFSSSKKYF